MPAWAVELLSIISNILGINQIIRGLLTDPNGPNSLPTLGLEIRANGIYLADNTVGLPAVRAMLLATDNDVVTARTDILAAIAALPGAGTPVVLPTIPPAGYGGASGSDVAGAVWSYVGGALNQPADVCLSFAAMMGSLASQLSHNALWGGYFAPILLRYGIPMSWTYGVPVLDLADLVVSEDLLATLTRQNPTLTVSWFTSAKGYVQLVASGYHEVGGWLTTIDDAQFLQVKADVLGSVAVLGVPVWPGLAKVTLGTPVALTTALSIGTPMDGVLLSITGVPTRAGAYDFDGLLSYVRLGALTFVSDNGDGEYPQNLGFTSEVYCPKSMARAAGVKVRTIGGVSGTVTPWVITPV